MLLTLVIVSVMTSVSTIRVVVEDTIEVVVAGAGVIVTSVETVAVSICVVKVLIQVNIAVRINSQPVYLRDEVDSSGRAGLCRLSDAIEESVSHTTSDGTADLTW